MARRSDAPGSSPLEGLGAPRGGAHRTRSGLAALLSSLAAVVAVVAVLGGLYLAFGRSSSDTGTTGGAAPAPVVADSPSVRASPRPTAAPSPTASPTPTDPAPSATPTATPTPSETAATDTSSGAPVGEDAGSGDEGGLTDLPVVVLNQSGTSGLAARTAANLRAAGWTVSSVGNFRGKVPSTTVYYPPGALAAAQAVAAELPGADRVRPVFTGISSTKITVILA